eukprot:2031060-Pyramimonas_sp.AAC.1
MPQSCASVLSLWHRRGHDRLQQPQVHSRKRSKRRDENWTFPDTEDPNRESVASPGRARESRSKNTSQTVGVGEGYL